MPPASRGASSAAFDGQRSLPHALHEGMLRWNRLHVGMSVERVTGVQQQLMPEQLAESLRFFYREHTDQARHHDLMRHAATALIATTALAVTTAIVTLLSPENNQDALFLLLPSVLVLMLGVVGMDLSLLYWEKNREHVEIARAFRMALQLLLTEGNIEADVNISTSIRKLNNSLSNKSENKKTRRKIENYNCERPDERDEHIRVLFELAKSNQRDNKYSVIKKRIDNGLKIGIQRSDFRSLRDYGELRYQLERYGKDWTQSSYYIANRWFIINLVVAVVGILLCILSISTGLSGI